MSRNLPQHHWQVSQYVDGENRKERHRELVTRSEMPGKKRLFLVLADERFADVDKDKKEYIVIPLGYGLPTVPNDTPRPENPEAFDHFFIPIIPKRYITAQPDKQQAADLREGWLYIFRNGYLWRELQVFSQGTMKDVNLQVFQGQDVRSASGQNDSRVIVPYKVNGGLQTVQVAYSEVQWSWARINAMGGMNPDEKEEPRLKSDTPMPLVSEGEAEKNRSERMQRISAGLTQWMAEGDGEHIQSVNNVTADIYSLRLHEKSELPVVFLYDPLGVARELAGNYQAAWGEMDELLENLSNPNPKKVDPKEYPFYPWYDSALLANKYFFGKIPEFEPDGVSDPRQGGKRQWEKAKIQRLQWQRKLSKTDIDKALGTVKRAEIRERIRYAKQALVDFLDTPHFEEMYTFIQAFDDYFTLAGPSGSGRAGYSSPNIKAWRTAENLIARLGDHEYTGDSPLEADPPNSATLTRDDPGARFLVKLANPENQHPLHARLFPKPLNGKDKGIPDLSPLALHAPEFNPQLAQIATVEEARGIVDFCCQFSRAADIPEEDFVKESVLRLVRATGVGNFAFRDSTVDQYLAGEFAEDEVLPKNLVLNKDGTPSDYATSESADNTAEGQEEADGSPVLQVLRRATLLVEGFVESTKDLYKEEFEVKVVHKAGKPPQPGDIIRLKDGTEYKVKILEVKESDIKVSKAEINNFSGYDNVTLQGGKLDTIEVYNPKNALVGAPSVEAYRKGKAFSSRGWARKRHSTDWRLAKMRTIVCEEASKIHWTARKAYDKGAYTKAILPLAFMFESWNLKNAGQTILAQWGKDNTDRAWADLRSAILDLGALALNVRELHVERLATRDTGLAVAKIMKTNPQLAEKILNARSFARGLGAVAGAYSCILSLEDMAENMSQGDDSAISHGTMAAGFAIGTVAEISGFLVSFGLAGEASLAATITGGPWAWVGLGVVLSGAALLTWVYTDDTPLEEWLTNGPFSLGIPDELAHDRVEVGGDWDGHRVWTEKCWSTLRVNPDGILVDFQPRNAGRLQGDENGNVYLKTEGGNVRHIGKVGQPFAFDVLMNSSGRFAGHQPGSDPQDKFGRWYETPNSSYMSLMEAIYTPSVDLTRKVTAGRSTAEITIQVPMYFDNKSLLVVELWEEYGGGKRFNTYEGIHVVTGEGSGPRTIKVTKPIGQALNAVVAKVSMDLYGDGEIRLPRPEGDQDAWVEVII